MVLAVPILAPESGYQYPIALVPFLVQPQLYEFELHHLNLSF